MSSMIIEYLSKYIELNDELISAIEESAFIRHYEKGTFLLKEGEIATESFFVLKGCIRSYTDVSGEEDTIDFYTEEQIATPLTYDQPIGSTHHLQCIEDTVVGVSTREMEEEGFKKFPAFESICRVMGEIMLSKSQQNFTDYKMATPEERYLNLIKNRPDLMQRVPQYQIASYLGMKPESLSRIRRRVAKK